MNMLVYDVYDFIHFRCGWVAGTGSRSQVNWSKVPATRPDIQLYTRAWLGLKNALVAVC